MFKLQYNTLKIYVDKLALFVQSDQCCICDPALLVLILFLYKGDLVIFLLSHYRCLLGPCFQVWCLGHGAHPANTWWSSVLEKWAWKEASWPLTNAKVKFTFNRLTTHLFTSAGRTGQLGTWKMLVLSSVVQFSISLDAMLIATY